MYTISQAARKAGLSRSTLLYYHRLGLLHPSARSSAGYRLYGPGEMARLEKIVFFRSTGASLADIVRMLDAESGKLRQMLENRLEELNRQIRLMRDQQQVIVRLLKHDNLPARYRGMTKEKWVALLRESGLDDESMHRWHLAFERMSPQGHHDFLASLGVAEDEIAAIRQWSRPMTADDAAG